MTLEYSNRGTSPGDDRPSLVACPFCDTEITGGSALRHHLPCDEQPTEDPR